VCSSLSFTLAPSYTGCAFISTSILTTEACCKAGICASLGNEQKHAAQPCFLSCSPLSRSVSPFPVCADEHVTSSLGSARINASKPNFNHIALFSRALLSSSSRAASSSSSLSSSAPHPRRQEIEAFPQEVKAVLLVAHQPPRPKTLGSPTSHGRRQDSEYRWPTSYASNAAFADRSSVWTPQKLEGFLGCL